MAVDAEAHGQRVSGLFSRIATWYDFLNHVLSLGIDIYWRYRLISFVQVEDKGRVLDLAAGTLDVVTLLRKRKAHLDVVGADFCFPMLVQGRRKVEDDPQVSLSCADGRQLPFKDSSFDCVTIAFGIRNILPREEAYAEIYRVLKPGGRLCILEFGSGKQRILKGVYNVYLTFILPVVGRLFSKDREAYSYLADTICEFPDKRALAQELVRSGFVDGGFVPLTLGIAYIHVGQKQS